MELNETLLQLLSQVPLTQEFLPKPDRLGSKLCGNQQTARLPPNLNLVRKAYYLNAVMRW
jgi:hypothetical protein